MIPFLFSFLLLNFSAEGPAAIGPGNAVEAYEEARGFTLSAAAIKRIGIKTRPLPAAGEINLPAAAVVRSRGATGVYRRREGWFKLVPAEVSAAAPGFRVRAKDLRAGDEVVEEGAAILRVTDINVSEKESPGEHEEHEGHED